jgi:quercetin dioxygenase-like cupin family protein
MRLYDPDGHVIEIGEPMDITVRRFHQQGWSVERIAEKTGMPHEFIEGAIKDEDVPTQASGGEHPQAGKQEEVQLISPPKQESAVQPEATVIKADMQGQDYARLLSGPPETYSMRSGAVTLQPGQTIGRHSTRANEEVIVVLEGEGALLLNEAQELPFKVGTIAYCPPDTEHDVKNTGSTVLRYIYVVARAK